MAWWRRRVDAPAETAVIEEEEVPPAPPPRIWPWLLLLLALVLAGLGAWWFLAREDDKTTMPRVIGLTEAEARARIADAELEADVDRRPSRRREGIVFAQTPGAGVQLDEGERVEVLVSSALIRVVVPSVRDLPEREARQKLEAANLEARVERVFAGARQGTVVEQEPRGGERVQRGTTVLLKVSKGRNLNPVPDVLGLTEAQAVRRLRAEGFTPRIFDVPSPDPRGTVVAQEPRGGVQAPPDARVRLNVSTGEQEGTPTERETTTVTTTETDETETTATPPANVRVPNVVGLAQTPALRQLEAAGLRGNVVYVTSRQPRGRVVLTRPAAGDTVRRGSRIEVQVSRGPGQAEDAEVPNVVGQDEATATATLEDAGFRVETITRRVTDASQRGRVVEQQPAAGASVPRGAVITLIVGA